MDDSEHLITTVEAARRLGVSRPRIQQYITEGRLPARKVGRDLATLERRPTGRPSTKADGTPGRHP
jgi:excisionase family DNA binding protein